MNIAKFLRTPVLKSICERLLLIMAIWPIFSRKFAVLSKRISCSELGKLVILSKSKNNILSRTIQLFSGVQLLALLLMLHLSLGQNLV